MAHMFDPAAAEFWVLVTFLIFMGIVFYLGVPALIAKALDKRAEEIKTELDEARRLREEAQQLLADYQRKAREAEEEAKVIVEQAKHEAEALATETKKSLSGKSRPPHQAGGRKDCPRRGAGRQRSACQRRRGCGRRCREDPQGARLRQRRQGPDRHQHQRPQGQAELSRCVR